MRKQPLPYQDNEMISRYIMSLSRYDKGYFLPPSHWLLINNVFVFYKSCHEPLLYCYIFSRSDFIDFTSEEVCKALAKGARLTQA